MPLLDVDLQVFRAFLEVAKNQHFGKSAKHLGISQPALSRQIKRLEDAVGIMLFVREVHGVKVTAAGKKLIPYLERVLSEVAQAQRSLDQALNLDKTLVRIGVVVSVGAFFIPEVLNTVRNQYPNISVYVQEGESSYIETAIQEGRIDLGIHVEPLTSDHLVTQRLWTESFVVVRPKRDESCDDSKMDWVLPLGPTVEERLRRLIAEPRITTRTDNLDTLRRLIESGKANALLPRSVASRLEWQVELVDPVGLEDRKVYVSHRGRPTLDSATKVLLGAIVDQAAPWSST